MGRLRLLLHISDGSLRQGEFAADHVHVRSTSFWNASLKLMYPESSTFLYKKYGTINGLSVKVSL